MSIAFKNPPVSESTKSKKRKTHGTRTGLIDAE